MALTRVKICGICRAVDAEAAVKLGANAIGIVLDRSAGRYVEPAEARRISEAAGPLVSVVGLFVNAPAEEIRRVADVVGLSAIQLHGEESPQVVAELKPLRVLKAVHVSVGETAVLSRWREAIAAQKLTNLAGLIVESARPCGPRGGTGVASDFEGLREMQISGAFAGLPPAIVAGGLTAENVGEVVRMLRPHGVDVSSGVEAGKREKSAEKIAAFVRAVRAADGDN